MSLLEHPQAQSLLADAVVTPEQVRGCQHRLTEVLQRDWPRFDRAEQRTHATLVILGLLGGLQRKTSEPIAVEAGVHRKPIQNFVGAGGWDDEEIMVEQLSHCLNGDSPNRVSTSMRSRTLAGKALRRIARSSSREASSRWMRIIPDLQSDRVQVLRIVRDRQCSQGVK